MEKDLYKASYMQDPFDILTSENLDRLEKHCKKAIHYERASGLLEHQLTLDLLYKYQEQQAELVKKDKIINEMSKELYVEGYCKEINCKQCTADSFTDCIKQYFERKVENVIK